MRFSVTTLSDLVAKCGALIEENLQETGGGHDPSYLDMDTYRALDESGRGFGVIVESDSGAPVGMAAIIVARHHHSGESTAENDTVFVTKSARAGALPGRLIAFCESHAKRLGCSRFQWCAPAGSKFESALARRYKPIQTMFEKELV